MNEMTDDLRQILSALADASAKRAVVNSPTVRFHPATMISDSGYVPTVDIGARWDGLPAQVRLDGDDTAVTYASNLCREPIPYGARVLVALAPPHGAFIVGMIDHWPVERGLLNRAQITSTFSKSTADFATTGLGCTFTAPDSGRVRVVVEGTGFANSSGADAGDLTLRLYNATDAVYVANGYRRVMNAGTSVRVESYLHVEWVVSSLLARRVYTWTLYYGTSDANTHGGYAADGSANWGPWSMEVWGVPAGVGT